MPRPPKRRQLTVFPVAAVLLSLNSGPLFAQPTSAEPADIGENTPAENASPDSAPEEPRAPEPRAPEPDSPGEKVSAPVSDEKTDTGVGNATGELSDDPRSEQPVSPQTDSAIPDEATRLEESRKSINLIAEIIEKIDDEATRSGNNWEFTLDDRPILLVTDENAGRMRIMTPITEASGLSTELLARMLQANFDSVLDTRYAIAQGLVWATFIHPLPSLTAYEIASGLFQTKTAADTFGTTFTSGAITYGGGDSTGIITEQLEELLKDLERDNQI